jgi:hypothetical protein
MEQLRLIAAAVALAIPAAVFALNAWISYQERGFVEPFDIPTALAFGILGAMVSRGSRIALYLGAALVVVYLVTAATGGVMAFVVYWVAALVLVLQALPITSRPRVRGTA